MAHTQEIFVTCGQGLEQILADELTQLGYEKITLGYRGVYVLIAKTNAIYHINYCSRIGGRVLLPLIKFKCFNSDVLYSNAQKIDWLSFIPKGKTFAIDANVNHKNIKNSLFAAQIVKDAICDQFRDRVGSRPDVETRDPDVQINLFIHGEQAIISIDTSGAPLHKRGYRQEAVEAPIQESLAAALLTIAGYTGEEILYDPCCGSGTFLIEAALIATKTPPGYLRKNWGFMNLPDFSQSEWLRVKLAADEKRQPLAPKKIFGTDVNKNAQRSTLVNLRASGYYKEVEVTHADFREFTPSVTPNFVITNPPHGKRLDDVDSLRRLYRQLGEFLKTKTAKPSKGFVFTGNLELAKEVGLAPKRRHVIENSGVDSRFLEFDLY